MTQKSLVEIGRALAKVSAGRAKLMYDTQWLELEDVLCIAEKILLEKWNTISPHSPLYEVEDYSDTFRHYSYMIRAYEAELPNSAFVVSLVRKGSEKPRFYPGRYGRGSLERGRFVTSLSLCVKSFSPPIEANGVVLFGMLEAEVAQIWEKRSSGDDHGVEYEHIEELYDRVHDFYFKRLES